MYIEIYIIKTRVPGNPPKTVSRQSPKKTIDRKKNKLISVRNRANIRIKYFDLVGIAHVKVVFISVPKMPALPILVSLKSEIPNLYKVFVFCMNPA